MDLLPHPLEGLRGIVLKVREKVIVVTDSEVEAEQKNIGSHGNSIRQGAVMYW